MEKQTVTDAKANVKDYRREIPVLDSEGKPVLGADGKPTVVANPDFGKEVEIPYSYDWFKIETDEEFNKKFSLEKKLELGNQREKATANSNARQKAVAPYAMSGDDLALEEFIKNYISKHKAKGRTKSREDAILAYEAMMAD